MHRFMFSAAVIGLACGSIGLPAQAQNDVQPRQFDVRLKIDPTLQEIMADAAEDELIGTLVYLDMQVDLDAIEREVRVQRASMQEQHRRVVVALQETAAATQGELAAYLEARQQQGTIGEFHAYWIVNGFFAEATKGEILEIAARPDVAMIYFDYPIELIEPVEPANEDGDVTAGNPEIGIVAVRAPEVWALGIDGTGVLVANIDTGVRGTHEALRDRWAGVADDRYQGHPEWAWFDPLTGTTFPVDSQGHGTHTMGTVTGGPPGRQVGVAPGAFWMAAGVIDRGGFEATVQNALRSFQWMADPDENPNTFFDVPAVCSNSWGIADGHPRPYSEDCHDFFWAAIDASEAAGTVQLFSAGNESTQGLRRPADRAINPYDSCAVAAVDARDDNWPLASFSSRGPTFCTDDGSPAIKPDIAAPGVSVVSSLSGSDTSYGPLSGTSMASPHVNGVVALMKQANPDLPVDEYKQIIYDTAFDLGTSGEDNLFGWGMVDAFEAVQEALARADFQYEFPDGLPTQVDPNGGTTFPIQIVLGQEEPVPGTGLLHTDDGSGWVETPVNELGNFMYEAIFPATTCPSTVQFYLSFESTDGDIIRSPFNAPQSTYQAFSISEIIVALEDDFEQDLGWTVVNIDLDLGPWERGVPVNGNDRTVPARDFDGSGQCYVTGNGLGTQFDVDGGPTRLLSPVFDASGMSNPIVTYARWFSNSNQDVDSLDVHVSNDGGSTWVLVERIQDRSNEDPKWEVAQWNARDFITLTDQMRVRFSVTDNPNNSLTEGAVDAFGVRDFVCASPADLTGFEVVLGTLISGDLSDLVDSDNQAVRARSGNGRTLAELHKMEMIVSAVTSVDSPSTMSIKVESRLSEPAGIGKVAVRNRNTGQFEQVGTFPITNTDGVDVVGGIDATNYVSGAGEFDVLLKTIVFVPFIAFEFDSFVDQTEFNVN